MRKNISKSFNILFNLLVLSARLSTLPVYLLLEIFTAPLPSPTQFAHRGGITPPPRPTIGPGGTVDDKRWARKRVCEKCSAMLCLRYGHSISKTCALSFVRSGLLLNWFMLIFMPSLIIHIINCFIYSKVSRQTNRTLKYCIASWACVSPELPAVAFVEGLQPGYAAVCPQQCVSQGNPATPKK